MKRKQPKEWRLKYDESLLIQKIKKLASKLYTIVKFAAHLTIGVVDGIYTLGRFTIRGAIIISMVYIIYSSNSFRSINIL